MSLFSRRVLYRAEPSVHSSGAALGRTLQCMCAPHPSAVAKDRWVGAASPAPVYGACCSIAGSKAAMRPVRIRPHRSARTDPRRAASCGRGAGRTLSSQFAILVCYPGRVGGRTTPPTSATVGLAHSRFSTRVGSIRWRRLADALVGCAGRPWRWIQGKPVDVWMRGAPRRRLG